MNYHQVNFLDACGRGRGHADFHIALMVDSRHLSAIPAGKRNHLYTSFMGCLYGT